MPLCHLLRILVVNISDFVSKNAARKKEVHELLLSPTNGGVLVLIGVDTPRNDSKYPIALISILDRFGRRVKRDGSAFPKR